jgi:hypothetical protein
MFVDKVRFEQESLPELLAAHPELSSQQVITELQHDIFAGRIPLHVPGLVDQLSTWVIAEAAGFTFDRGSVVVATPMLSNVDTDTWQVHFDDVDYPYMFRAPDWHAWVVSRFGDTSASIVNIAPEQHVGPQNSGSVTQNVGPFYINTAFSGSSKAKELRDYTAADLDTCIDDIAARTGGKTDRETIRKDGPPLLESRGIRVVTGTVRALELRYDQPIHHHQHRTRGERRPRG